MKVGDLVTLKCPPIPLVGKLFIVTVVKDNWCKGTWSADTRFIEDFRIINE